MNVGVVGLGKLGLPLACVLADRGHNVRAWDDDLDVRLAYKSREAYVDESGVQEMLMRYGRNNLGLDTPYGMGENCDAVFIVVPTPSNDDGSFDDGIIEEVIRDLLPGVAHRDAEAESLIIMLVSTVSPGTCERLARLLPSNACLVYAPVFIALGTVVSDLAHPQIRIIGLPQDYELSDIHRDSALDHLVWGGSQSYMTYREAEIAKIAFNVFVTLKITFANGIGQLCHLHGANVDTVISSIINDERIGGRLMLRAGGGYGGPCLPRDNRALENALTGMVSLSSYVDWLNVEHAKFIVDIALNGRSGPGKCAVIGTAYKEGTPYEIESFGTMLVDLLDQQGWYVTGAHQADVIIIALPCRDIDFRGELKAGSRVVDVWRAHGYLRTMDVDYVQFGGTSCAST